jgi:hypothetical protein
MQFVVGVWVPLWKFLTPSKANQGSKEKDNSHENSDNTPEAEKRKGGYGAASLAGLLLGSAMVARGEIGLLIIEIGYNETPYVSEDGFITAIWAILLNTIVGPIVVGCLVKFYGKKIGEGEWGLQRAATPRTEEDHPV